MSVYIGHSSGSKPSVAAAAAADILEAELALGGTPPGNRYYGTNATAVRGFYPLPTGGPGGGATNLGINLTATVVTLSSSSGTGVDIPAATVTLAGAMTAADRIKLNGIATGATANASDSALRDRSTHTGTQSMSTIAGLASALGLKADLSAATFGNLGATDYISIFDTQSSFTLTLEFATDLTNDQTITFPNASGTIALVGHQHVINDLSNASPLGKSLLALATPGATRFAAFNSAGTVTLLDEPNFRSAIGAPAADDPRFTDARTPTAHAHPASAISDSTTLGRALMTAANPSAVRYVRINSDNSVSLLDAAAFLSAIGGGAGSPAGSGTEIQFRNGTGFGAVPNSSVSGGAVTFGGAENYGSTPQVLLSLRNTTAATNPAAQQVFTGQQSSPAFQVEGQGWDYTGGVAASTPVRVRGYLQPQTPFGLAAAPNILFRIETQVGAGAWSRLVEFRQSPAQGFYANFGPSGTVSLGGSSNTGSFPDGASTAAVILSGTTSAVDAVRMTGSGGLVWTSDGTIFSSISTWMRRRAAANVCFGAADAAAPVAQTISVQGVSAGTSNTSGALWSLDCSQGTGTGTGGAARIRTAPAGSSGTAQNGFVDSFTVRPGRGIALSNGNFAAASDCIAEMTVLRGSTSGTTPVILSESALGGGLAIPLNAVMQAIVLVQGMSEAGDVARYARQICVKNFAGTSTLQSSPVTVGADDSGTTALSITVSDSTDTLDISVTGTAGTNWRWNAAVFDGELVRNVPA
jgi:hypothetical protein